MAVIDPRDKEKLFTQTRTRLGAPERGVELEDGPLETLLDIALEDYSAMINNWLIEHQWPNLAGMDLNANDIARALITRSFDYVSQFTYAYSKQVGLQNMGPYELKKDYVELSANTQCYEVPAGREINEVLWYQPPALSQSALDPYLGTWATTFSAEFGASGYYMMPAYDVILRTADISLKNRLFRGELTYKVTAGPNGTKKLWLYPVPGGTYDIGNRFLSQGKVWYFYYDIDTGARNQCLADNKDIVKLPSDVPLDNLSWDDLNKPSRTWVRSYLLALAKETLGRIRGKFSGAIKVGEPETTLAYAELLQEGKEEQENLKKELTDRLMRFSSLEMLKREAEEAEAINKALQYRPLPGTIR